MNDHLRCEFKELYCRKDLDAIEGFANAYSNLWEHGMDLESITGKRRPLEKDCGRFDALVEVSSCLWAMFPAFDPVSMDELGFQIDNMREQLDEKDREEEREIASRELFVEYTVFEASELPEDVDNSVDASSWFEDKDELKNYLVYFCPRTRWYMSYNKQTKKYWAMIDRSDFETDDFMEMVSIMRKGYFI